jgi:chitinase
MMKRTVCFAALAMAVFGTGLAQSARVVGYLPDYRFYTSTQIEYCKLTHLNLSFANPDHDGNIIFTDISSVMADAREDNPGIIICVSFGGAGLTEQQAADWSLLIDTAGNRPAFISKIVNYILDNDLDGADIDLEWGDVTSGYSDFIVELDTALAAQGKLLTAALPNQVLYSNVNQAALDAFDFINIMAYDATGPWNPTSPGQHSSYSFAANGVNFWKNTVGIPGPRLTLGVPFYGYNFVDAAIAYDFTYASMVEADTGNAELDQVGTAYYNGRPTIRSKVELASEQVGGIMIWELGQDTFDQYSLLSAIHEKYTVLGVSTTGLCGNEAVSDHQRPGTGDGFRVYPNPASAYFMIESGPCPLRQIEITCITGQVVAVRLCPPGTRSVQLDLPVLEKGIYFVTVAGIDGRRNTEKLIVY